MSPEIPAGYLQIYGQPGSDYVATALETALIALMPNPKSLDVKIQYTFTNSVSVTLPVAFQQNLTLSPTTGRVIQSAVDAWFEANQPSTESAVWLFAAVTSTEPPQTPLWFCGLDAPVPV